jgi:predicted metal-binding membrane protein
MPLTMLKQQLIIWLALLAVIGIAWLYLFYQYERMATLPMSEMWMPPTETSDWQWQDFWWVYLMWAVMMAAMMLPSAIPMILAYARICRQRKLNDRLSSALFSTAYLLIWLLFSIALTLLQWQMHGLHFLSPMMDNRNETMAAVIFILAGIYQWMPVKDFFLQNCRSPVGFLLTEWREGTIGSIQMGLKHGSMCVGCCWAQMMIMFAVGVMNLWAMVLIAALVLVEKILPRYQQSFSQAIGIVFLGWGIWLLL